MHQQASLDLNTTQVNKKHQYSQNTLIQRQSFWGNSEKLMNINNQQTINKSSNKIVTKQKQKHSKE